MLVSARPERWSGRTALEAAEFLLSPQMAGQHGFPKALRADNARQFNHHLLDALPKLTKVEVDLQSRYGVPEKNSFKEANP